MCNTELLTRKFGEIRKYLDIVTPISVCMKETLSYENYSHSIDIPTSYDDFYVYGIGMIKEDFQKTLTGEIGYQPCIEILLAKEPRKYISKK